MVVDEMVLPQTIGASSMNSDDEKYDMSDRDDVLKAVTKDWTILSRSQQFQSDEEIVLAAVGQNENALHYAHNNLCQDLKFMQTAVSWNGCALRYASPELKNNRSLAEKAIVRNWQVTSLLHGTSFY
jgi:hypothetical protein